MTAVTDQLRAFENAAIDAVSATTPWLAPLIPAAIAHRHMIDVLDFAPWLALIGAGVIEFLGLSAIHTAVQFWAFNQRRRKSDTPAPVWWPVAIGGFYLALILSVNVILAEAPWRHILATTLLSLVSVPAGFVIAVRAQHAAYIGQIKAERQERRAVRRPRSNRSQAVTKAVTNRADVNDLPGDFRLLNDRHKQQAAAMTTSELVEVAGISDSTARRWKRELNGRNGHK